MERTDLSNFDEGQVVLWVGASSKTAALVGCSRYTVVSIDHMVTWTANGVLILTLLLIGV